MRDLDALRLHVQQLGVSIKAALKEWSLLDDAIRAGERARDKRIIDCG